MAVRSSTSWRRLPRPPGPRFIGFVSETVSDAALIQRMGARHLGPVEALADLDAVYTLGVADGATRRSLDDRISRWRREAVVLAPRGNFRGRRRPGSRSADRGGSPGHDERASRPPRAHERQRCRLPRLPHRCLLHPVTGRSPQPRRHHGRRGLLRNRGDRHARRLNGSTTAGVPNSRRTCRRGHGRRVPARTTGRER